MAKILVVDDSMFIRMSLKQLLEKCGHSVVGMAGNGADAVKQYQALKPDVVTLDVIMDSYEDSTILDGLVALEQIRGLDPQAKIIMVTSLAETAVREKAIGLGASGFILKPFKPEDVKTALDAVMKP